MKGKRDGLQSVERTRGDLPGMCGIEEGWSTECGRTRGDQPGMCGREEGWSTIVFRRDKG